MEGGGAEGRMVEVDNFDTHEHTHKNTCAYT
jgi:hypothetical protein